MGANEDDGATGDLDVTDDLIIHGNGSFISGGQDRAFHIHGVRVNMTDVAIGNSRASQGAAIFSDGGELSLANVWITDNRATGAFHVAGGAIYAARGSVEIVHSQIGVPGSPNAAFSSNGAALGGGIYGIDTKLVIKQSVIDGNWAIADAWALSNSIAAAGGAIYTTDSHVTILNSKITNGVASDRFESDGTYAGAAVFSLRGSLEIVGSELDRNEARAFHADAFARGGAIYADNANVSITNSTFFSNRASANTGEGGAIHTVRGSLTSIKNRFEFNEAGGAGFGGAIFINDALASLVNNLFAFNSSGSGSGSGGAMYVIGAIVTLTSCTFDSNVGHLGGAMYVASGVVTIVNCNFARNTAAIGGAIYIASGTVSLTKSTTFEDNVATLMADEIFELI